MGEPRTIALLHEYDGTDYLGWQFQEVGPSIQGELQKALTQMTGQTDIRIRVAGRTDAGVHALAQVASFTTTSTIDIEKFGPGLNTILPNTISVHRAVEMPLDFDAKSESRSKQYRYRFYNAPQPAALERRSWWRKKPLNLDAMREASKALVGEHDFESFRSTKCDAPHAVRMMKSISVVERPRPPVGRAVEVVFHANAYCRHMCRILAGTLMEIGIGKRPPGSIPDILSAADRRASGVTAPPTGLTLLNVDYPHPELSQLAHGPAEEP